MGEFSSASIGRRFPPSCYLSKNGNRYADLHERVLQIRTRIDVAGVGVITIGILLM